MGGEKRSGGGNCFINIVSWCVGRKRNMLEGGLRSVKCSVLLKENLFINENIMQINNFVSKALLFVEISSEFS